MPGHRSLRARAYEASSIGSSDFPPAEVGVTMSLARGAHPVRGKGRAHPPKRSEGYEPSFSLIRADSGHSMKGDSYVGRTSPSASSQSRTIQKALQGLP